MRSFRQYRTKSDPGKRSLPRATSPGANEKTQEEIDFSPSMKLFFTSVSVSAKLPFLGDAIIAIVNALVDKENRWWCGESVMVREGECDMRSTTIPSNPRNCRLWQGLRMLESLRSLFRAKGLGAQRADLGLVGDPFAPIIVGIRLYYA